jgi:hypothetical protein
LVIFGKELLHEGQRQEVLCARQLPARALSEEEIVLVLLGREAAFGFGVAVDKIVIVGVADVYSLLCHAEIGEGRCAIHHPAWFTSVRSAPVGAPHADRA